MENFNVTGYPVDAKRRFAPSILSHPEVANTWLEIQNLSKEYNP